MYEPPKATFSATGTSALLSDRSNATPHSSQAVTADTRNTSASTPAVTAQDQWFTDREYIDVSPIPPTSTARAPTNASGGNTAATTKQVGPATPMRRTQRFTAL